MRAHGVVHVRHEGGGLVPERPARRGVRHKVGVRRAVPAVPLRVDVLHHDDGVCAHPGTRGCRSRVRRGGDAAAERRGRGGADQAAARAQGERPSGQVRQGARSGDDGGEGVPAMRQVGREDTVPFRDAHRGVAPRGEVHAVVRHNVDDGREGRLGVRQGGVDAAHGVHLHHRFVAEAGGGSVQVAAGAEHLAAVQPGAPKVVRGEGGGC
mmetsp:Transcript_1576/g.6491  ORF Transcript_1576/g.6491 Transcript_1576/m.6491 type:complete len:210 (+) Transcript_1576:963-1592(+)